MKRRILTHFFSVLMVYFLSGLALPSSAQGQPEQGKPAKAEGEKAQPKAFRIPIPDEQGLIQKIFEIKHADVAQLANVLGYFAPIQANRELRVIVVKGSPEVVATIENAIKRFDVPPAPAKNIDLTAYLLVSSAQATPGSIPAELDGVIKQLKGVFKYQGFRLLDTLVVRSRNGWQGELNGVAPRNADDEVNVPPTLYQFRFESARITSDNSDQMIRIDGLRLGARVPIKQGNDNWNYIDTGINTNIDVREGQKVVVGKATIGGSDSALFLVLTAKVVD
jgi:hypothetical protein